MTRLTHLLGTAAMALTLATAATAQDAATDAPATEAPAEAPATEAPATEAPATQAAPAEAAAPTADPATVVATVDGTDITLGQLIIARAQLPQQYEQFPPEVIFEGLLDQVVQQQLLSNSLTEAPDRLNWALANEERSLRAGEVITDLSTAAVTEEAIQAAYDELSAAAAAEPVQEWSAAHLLVATEEEAVAAAARIEGGEDFAAVATEVSSDGSAAQGGDLGWFGPGQMVPEFETAVADMEVGGVSAPVQSQFGWHLIQLNEVRDRPVPALDEMRPEIVGQLQEAVILAKIEELTASAEIILPEPGAIDPAVLTNTDLLDK
ncbi:peptidyl-prolyl cis-trans isomerase C [Loktanella fryxellensis]|uniref:Parvulin-like PPIase n=1 Tax=Loktanella fryxellensis TaxID=245187 RepID=A0A1H8DS51_9RHOB|nr:peptidylprolyl isomerase [Loktanella fryxellensis]SEN10092.1 peptidyl-prolyl cis-trans isomerase C [Loktanella fryxellensis]